MKYIGKIVCKGGLLLINQTFYQPDNQKYGRKIVSRVEDMLNLIPHKVAEMAEINRFDNHHAVVLFQI